MQIVSGARHNTECGVTSEANWRRQHAFSVDSAPADSGGIGSTFVGWYKWKYYYFIIQLKCQCFSYK